MGGFSFRNNLVIPSKRLKLSASEYLSFSEKNGSDITKTTFLPPKIGGKGFGMFEVTLRSSAIGLR